jgi:hypothetical protein
VLFSFLVFVLVVTNKHIKLLFNGLFVELVEDLLVACFTLEIYTEKGWLISFGIEFDDVNAYFASNFFFLRVITLINDCAIHV